MNIGGFITFLDLTNPYITQSFKKKADRSIDRSIDRYIDSNSISPKNDGNFCKDDVSLN